MLEDGAATEQRGFIMILLMTLLNVAKLNLKFRSPENIDEFFESLGIGQLSEQSPNFGELLEEICEELNLADWKEPSNPRHPVFTVLKFLMENVEEYVRGIANADANRFSTAVHGVAHPIQVHWRILPVQYRVQINAGTQCLKVILAMNLKI